jgi:hypothetical protein
MTDAERIAEYLLAIQWANVTAEDVRVYMSTSRADADPDSCYEAVAGLMAILADVRREEREACIAAIDAEQREWAGDHPRSALDCARERIVKRGAK